MRSRLAVVLLVAFVLAPFLISRRTLIVLFFPKTASAQYGGHTTYTAKSRSYPATVQQGTILVMFRESASLIKIDEILKENQLEIRSGIPGLSLFVVMTRQPPSSCEDETERLRAIIERLKQYVEIEAAVTNVRLSPTLIPRRNAPIPPATGCWSWTGCANEDRNGTRPLITMKFPQAWNFSAAMQGRHCTVGVLDIGFVPHRRDLRMRSASRCGTNADFHGTHIAGVIGAGFGNGVGIDGAAGGFADIVTCAPLIEQPRARAELRDLSVSEAQTLGVVERGQSFESCLRSLETLLHEPLRVINASIGYNWSELSIVPEENPGAQQIVREQGLMVRKLLAQFPKTVLVTSAGNDCRSSNCTQQAMWTSPFNWAALGDPTPLEPRSTNVIVVEALDRGGRELDTSNRGGTIAAIGQNIVSTGDNNSYGSCGEGTSCSAPFVTATIALMLSLDPNLEVSDLKTRLLIGGRTLNAFEAVKACDPRADLHLADIDNSGTVDIRDLLLFDNRLTTTDPRELSLSRLDVTGDGNVNGADRRFIEQMIR